MKKCFVLIIVLIAGANSQQKYLEIAKQNYEKQKYTTVTNYLNSVISSNSISDKEALSQINLYIGFAYFRQGKVELGTTRIINALELNPECEVDRTVFKGETVELFEKLRKENVGSLTVTSEPEDVRIFINNKFAGKTPLTIDKIFHGRSMITALKNGYEMKTENYALQPGVMNEVYFRLKENNLYSLYVTTTPEGADIYTDGVFRGITPLFMDDLEAKTYEVKVSHKGYKSIVEDVEIPFSGDTGLHVELGKKSNYMLYSVFIPGSGQAKMKKYYHALATAGLAAGWSLYYLYYINNEPEWPYRDIDLTILNYYGGAGHSWIYTINGEVVDKETFFMENEKKLYEDIEYDNWYKKKERLQGIGIVVYVLNVLDMWYLSRTAQNEGLSSATDNLSVSLQHRKEYVGLNVRYSF